MNVFNLKRSYFNLFKVYDYNNNKNNNKIIKEVIKYYNFNKIQYIHNIIFNKRTLQDYLNNTTTTTNKNNNNNSYNNNSYNRNNNNNNKSSYNQRNSSNTFNNRNNYNNNNNNNNNKEIDFQLLESFIKNIIKQQNNNSKNDLHLLDVAECILNSNASFNSFNLIKLINAISTQPITNETQEIIKSLVLKADLEEKVPIQNIGKLFNEIKILLEHESSTISPELLSLFSKYLLQTRDDLKNKDIEDIIHYTLDKNMLDSNHKLYSSILLLYTNLSKHILKRLQKAKSEKNYIPFHCGTTNAVEILSLNSYCNLVLKLEPYLNITEVNSLFHSLNRMVCLDFLCYKTKLDDNKLTNITTCPCGNVNLFKNTELLQENSSESINKINSPLKDDQNTIKVFDYLISLQSQNKKIKSIIRKLSELTGQTIPLDINPTTLSSSILSSTLSTEIKIQPIDQVIQQISDDLIKYNNVDNNKSDINNNNNNNNNNLRQELYLYPELIEKSTGILTPKLLCESISCLQYLPITIEENVKLVRSLLRVIYYKYLKQDSYYSYHTTNLLSTQLLTNENCVQYKKSYISENKQNLMYITNENIVNGILGLQYLECNHHLIQHFLIIFTDYLITTFKFNEILTPNEILQIMKGIQLIDTKTIEINNLLFIISEHISKQSSNLLFNLQNKYDKNSSTTVTTFPSSYTSNNICETISYFSNKSSNSKVFRKLLFSFSNKINEVNEVFDDKLMIMCLKGLQNTNCQFNETQILLEQLNSKFQNHIPVSQGNDISYYNKDNLYKILQLLLPFHSTTLQIRNLINIITYKLFNNTNSVYVNNNNENDNNNYDNERKNILIGLSSLNIMSSEFPEVRYFLTYLTNELYTIPPSSLNLLNSKNLSTEISNDNFNFLQIFSKFHSLHSKYPEVQSFLSSLLPHIQYQNNSSIKNMVDINLISNSIYGLQNLIGNYDKYNEMIILHLPLVQNHFNVEFNKSKKNSINLSKMNIISKIIYGMVYVPSTPLSTNNMNLISKETNETSFEYSENAISTLNHIITYLESIELPFEKCLEYGSLIINENKNRQTKIDILETIGQYQSSYSSINRSLSLLHYYTSKYQQLPTEMIDRITLLKEENQLKYNEIYNCYLNVLDKYKKSHEKTSSLNPKITYSNLDENEMLPGQNDTVSKIEYQLVDELKKLIQEDYHHIDVIKNGFIDGFQTDILFKIYLSDDFQEINNENDENLNINSFLELNNDNTKNKNKKNDKYIVLNFEIDGPEHQYEKRLTFGQRRDEYLTNKYQIYIQRINLLDYGLLNQSTTISSLYGTIAKFEWKKCLRNLKKKKLIKK